MNNSIQWIIWTAVAAGLSYNRRSHGNQWAPVGSIGLQSAPLGSIGLHWAPLGSIGLQSAPLGSSRLVWRPVVVAVVVDRFAVALSVDCPRLESTGSVLSAARMSIDKWQQKPKVVEVATTMTD